MSLCVLCVYCVCTVCVLCVYSVYCVCIVCVLCVCTLCVLCVYSVYCMSRGLRQVCVWNGWRLPPGRPGQRALQYSLVSYMVLCSSQTPHLRELVWCLPCVERFAGWLRERKLKKCHYLNVNAYSVFQFACHKPLAQSGFKSTPIDQIVSFHTQPVCIVNMTNNNIF